MRPKRVADQGSAAFSRASRAGDPGGDPLGILRGSDPFFGDPGFLRGQNTLVSEGSCRTTLPLYNIN